MGSMTAVIAAPAPKLLTPAQRRRAKIIGIVLLVLAAFTLLVFGIGTEGDATFKFVIPGQSPTEIPDLTVPGAGSSILLAGVLAFLGAIQVTRGFGDKANLVLGIGLILFVLAFLIWAAAGSPLGAFNFTSMLRETVLRSFPIAMGALSGVLCERVAVINIGIEGMLLGGAFMAALVGSTQGPWWGIVAGVLTGGALAWVLAVLAVRYRVDQIIAGVVINIFVLGITSFLTVRLFAENPQFNNAQILKPWKVPLLGDIPIIGDIFFRQTIFVYALFVLVAGLTFGLFRTKWGLRSRAVGEHPKAADTLGINVYRMRYLNVVLGGMIAGLGGAWFIIGSVGRFDENMTNGRGFIGLAAMIFGRWHPIGALGAALVFGFADSLKQVLGILQTGIPSEFLLMAPAIVTVVVVAGLVGKSRPPAADGQPYVKE
ncbi:MAG: ABC transporter permease [Acidimicrobiia bacterium]|nr:ABC transporter permease [Acidimicrobiia bacterium]